MEPVLAKDALKVLLMNYADQHLPDDVPGRFIKQMIANMGGTTEPVTARVSADPVASAVSVLPAKTVTLPRIEGNGIVRQSNFRALPKPEHPDTMTKGEKISATRAANKAARLAGHQVADEAVNNCMNSLMGG